MPTAGTVMTVRGPVDPVELGRTITHEHIFFAVPEFFLMPNDPQQARLAAEPVRAENLWWVNTYPFGSKDNLALDDFDAACAEVGHFVAEGGRTIVEMTTRGICPNPSSLRRLSEVTGVHIVAGTGYYVAATRPYDFADRSVAEIAAEIERDVVGGFEGTNIRAGIIGELGIGGSGPQPSVRSVTQLDPGDVKLLEAAAVVQRRTGLAISLHTPRCSLRGIGQAPVVLDILDILEDAGANLGRVVAGHMDRSPWESVEALAEIAARGSYVQFDHWGYEGYASLDLCFAFDEQRARFTRGLIAEGFADRLLWSHDLCEKRMWRRHGGRGYAHVLRFVAPLLRRQGVTRETIEQILVANPARMLTIQPHVASPSAGAARNA